eukprot:192004_1
MTTKTRQTPKERVASTGIIAGFNKGHKTTKRVRPVSTKARLALPHKKVRAVKAVISELVGLSPLEKRVQELLRVGKEKRALKFCNKRLGNITAAKKKRSKVEDLLRSQKKK